MKSKLMQSEATLEENKCVMEGLRASNTAVKASIRTLILTVARTQDLSLNPMFLTRPGMIVFSFGTMLS